MTVGQFLPRKCYISRNVRFASTSVWSLEERAVEMVAFPPAKTTETIQ